MNPFEVIGEELPKFLGDEEVTGGLRGFLRGLALQPSNKSVMAPMDEEERMRALASYLPTAGVMAPFVGPAFRAATTFPRATGALTAVATQDPSSAFLGPLGAGLTYSPEAEASKFTDSLKGIDKFLAAHGTPHIFPPTANNPLGEFSLAKMGTGEGAQVFMPGHYLAGNPQISRVHYRDRLVDRLNQDLLQGANSPYNNLVTQLTQGVIPGNLKVPKDMSQILAKKVSAGADLQKDYNKLIDPKETMKFWEKRIESDNRSQFVNELDELVRGASPEELFSEKYFERFKELDKQATKAQKIVRDAETKALTRVRNELFPQKPRAEDYEPYPSPHGAYPPSRYYNPEYKALDAIWQTKYEAARKKAMEEMRASLPENVRRFGVDDALVTKALLQRAKRVMAHKALIEHPELEAAKAKAAAERPDLHQGALYTVEVNASPSDMLPLDLPLGELRTDMPRIYSAYDEALKGAGIGRGLSELADEHTPMTAWNVFRTRNSRAGALKLMNELNSRNVPGNFFLSSGRRKLNTSKDFDPAAFNYVIFNDEVPQIIARELGKQR